MLLITAFFFILAHLKYCETFNLCFLDLKCKAVYGDLYFPVFDELHFCLIFIASKTQLVV